MTAEITQKNKVIKKLLNELIFEVYHLQNSKEEYPEPADELMLELTLNELKTAFR